MYLKMAQLLILLCLCLVFQESRQQIQRKQMINLGDSFNLEGNDGTEDGFSRALADSSLGGELGNEDSASSQMHISENNQGGVSLGQNSDELGPLGSLMGGNSLNSFSLNALSSLGDELGLGGRGAKDNGLLESLGDTKSFLSGGDQLSNYGDGGKQPDMNDESSNLLEAFGLKGGNENRESDNSLENILGGGKEKSLMSLLSLGEDNAKAKSQANTLIDGLNLDEADSNNNVENTANLGDSLNMGSNTDLLGLNKNDLATLLGGNDGNSHSVPQSALKPSKQNAETNDESLSMLQKLINGQGTTNGGDRQGIGDFEDGGGGLSNELNQLDTVDDKLEKMLEGLGKVDAGATQSSNHEDNMAQQDSQPSDAADEMPAAGYYEHNGPMQTMGHDGGVGGGDYYGMGNMMNGLNIGGVMNGDTTGGYGGDEASNMLQRIAGGTLGGQHIQYGNTVHAHASDNPRNPNKVSPAQAAEKAEQVQKDAQSKHEAKLRKLKGRLAALKQKLEELQEEQSKKSQNADSPKARRKEAIKRLLIKNLKLAAVIASKEIQLEEAKESAFTGKKETDDLSLLDIAKNKETQKPSEIVETSSKTKAKPLTDLSKKAEEEVNHLIKAQGISKIRRDKSLPVSQGKDASTKKENKEDNKEKGKKLESNATIIEQINATLAKLSASSPKNVSVSPKAYKKLVQRITQLSPKKSQAVQEAALSSLYKALMKSQPTVSGNPKKLSIKYLDIGCYKDNSKRAISSLESSFKSPLDRNYKTRLNSLYKCARIAKLKGFPGFALENGGQCFGDKDILNKYKTYGTSHTCGMGGKGGTWSLNVYKFV